MTQPFVLGRARPDWADPGQPRQCMARLDMAWTPDFRTPLGRASAVLAPAALRWARHGVASQDKDVARRVGARRARAGLLAAMRGMARISRGGWQPSGFEAPTPMQGMARPGSARQCTARRGMASRGLARLRWSGQGKDHKDDWQALRFEPGASARAWRGYVRPGTARRGGASPDGPRRGKAWNTE